MKSLGPRPARAESCPCHPEHLCSRFVCMVDFDGSGSLTVQDIFGFINAWFAGCN